MARIRTFEQQAEAVLDAVKGYLDSTARKHECVGYDCKFCALNGDRYVECKALVLEAL